jgi:hypothetical protein
MSAALLDFSPSPQELPGGHGYDSSVRAPADIWRGGETAALQRLKVRRSSETFIFQNRAH